MCEQKILEKYVDPVFSPEGVKEEAEEAGMEVDTVVVDMLNIS